MGVELIIRIAMIGLLTALMVQLLKQTGKDEFATLIVIAGVLVVVLMVINQISTLFENVRRIFQLY